MTGIKQHRVRVVLGCELNFPAWTEPCLTINLGIRNRNIFPPPWDWIMILSHGHRVNITYTVSLGLDFTVQTVYSRALLKCNLSPFSQECLIEILVEMFGDAAVPKMFKGEKITITVDKKKACIDLVDLSVACEDPKLKTTVQGAVTRLHMSLNTPKSLEVERSKPKVKSEVKSEVKTEIKAEPEEAW